MGCKPLRLNPVSIAEDGTVSVDTDRFFARESYHPAQAVAPRPGSRFDNSGLEALAVSYDKPTPKERSHG
jgi:hypothetical protein